MLGEVGDPATHTSQSAFPELSPPTPPPSFFKLASTASNLSSCSRTATLVVPGWTLEYVVENDTGRVNFRKSADRLERKLEVAVCVLGLAKLSRAAGAGSGMALTEAWGDEGRSSWSSKGFRLHDDPHLRL